MARQSAAAPAARVSRASAAATASAEMEAASADTSLIAGRTPRSVKKSRKALEMDDAASPRQRLSHASPAKAAPITAAPEPARETPSTSTARRTSRRSAASAATIAAPEASDAEDDLSTVAALSPKRKSGRVSYPPAAEALTLAERRAELAKLPVASAVRGASPSPPTPERPKRSTRGTRATARDAVPTSSVSIADSLEDESAGRASAQDSEEEVEEVSAPQPLATPRASRRRITDIAAPQYGASSRATRRASMESTPQAGSRSTRAAHAPSTSAQEPVVPAINGDADALGLSPAKAPKSAWQKKTFLNAGLYASSTSDEAAPRAARASMSGAKAAPSTSARGRGRASLPAPTGTARTRGKQGASAFPAPVHYGETLLSGSRDFRLSFPIAEQEDALRNKLAAKRKPPPYGLISTNRWVSRKRIHGEIPVCQCEPGDTCGDECMNRMMQYVCSEKTCPCGDRCTNVSLGRRPGAKTDVAYYGERGFGLRAAQDIPAKSFIGEYRGEVIDTAECGRRVTQYYKDTGNFYFLDYDAAAGEVLDGGLRGNSARFANHSCDPNCYIEKWLISGSDEERDAEFQIGLFALRDIKAGDELTYDYGWSAFAARKAVAGGLAASSVAGGLSGGLGRGLSGLGGMMSSFAGPSSFAGALNAADVAAPALASAEMTMSERCLCGAGNCAGILGGKKAPPTAAANRQLIACATAAEAGAKVKAAKAARDNSSRSSQADSNALSVPNTPSRSNASARSSVAVEPLTSSQREREASSSRASEARSARSLARGSPVQSLTPPRAARVGRRSGAASRRLAPMDLDSDAGTTASRSSGAEDMPALRLPLIAPVAQQQQQDDVEMSVDSAAGPAASPSVAAPAASEPAGADTAPAAAQADSPAPEADDASLVRTTRLGRNVKAPVRWAPSLAPTFHRKRKTPPPGDKPATAPQKLPNGLPWKYRPVEKRVSRKSASAAPDAQAGAEASSSTVPADAGTAATSKSLGKRKRGSAAGTAEASASAAGEQDAEADGDKRPRLEGPDGSADAAPAAPVKKKRGPKKKRKPGRPRTRKRPFFDFSKFPPGTEFVTSDGKPYDFTREHKVGRKPKIYTREQYQRKIVEKRDRNAFLARMRRRQADAEGEGDGEDGDDASDGSGSDSLSDKSDEEQMPAIGEASGSGSRANGSSPARGSRAPSLAKSASGSTVPVVGAPLTKAERTNLEMTTEDYRFAAISRLLYLKSAKKAMADAGMDETDIRKAKNGYLARMRRLKLRGYGEEAAARLAYKTQKEDGPETPLARAVAILDVARNEYKLEHAKENARQRRERYKNKKRTQAAAASDEAGPDDAGAAAGSSSAAGAAAGSPAAAGAASGSSAAGPSNAGAAAGSSAAAVVAARAAPNSAAGEGRSVGAEPGQFEVMARPPQPPKAKAKAAPRTAVPRPSARPTAAPSARPAAGASAPLAPPAPPAPLSDEPLRAPDAAPPSRAAANGHAAPANGDERAEAQPSGSAMNPSNFLEQRRSIASATRS